MAVPSGQIGPASSEVAFGIALNLKKLGLTSDPRWALYRLQDLHLYLLVRGPIAVKPYAIPEFIRSVTQLWYWS